MSLQDDHYNITAHMETLRSGLKRGSRGYKEAVALHQAYLRVWEAFNDQENESERLRPVVNLLTNAIASTVRNVIDTEYVHGKKGKK
jgi:hypothetical protein